MSLLENENFKKLIKKEESYLAIFKIPAEFDSDVQLFIKGDYSQMSETAKNIIKEYSCLEYNYDCEDSDEDINKFGKTPLYTDDLLLVLDKSPELRKKWEKEFGEIITIVIPESCELLPPPGKAAFIDLAA